MLISGRNDIDRATENFFTDAHVFVPSHLSYLQPQPAALPIDLRGDVLVRMRIESLREDDRLGLLDIIKRYESLREYLHHVCLASIASRYR